MVSMGESSESNAADIPRADIADAANDSTNPAPPKAVATRPAPPPSRSVVTGPARATAAPTKASGPARAVPTADLDEGTDGPSTSSL